MARPSFGALVDDAARAAGFNDYQLAGAIGLLPGRKVFSPKQVARLRRGETQSVSRALVQRLIEVLELDPGEAWAASGLWPPGLTPEQYKELRERGEGTDGLDVSDTADTDDTRGALPATVLAGASPVATDPTQDVRLDAADPTSQEVQADPAGRAAGGRKRTNGCKSGLPEEPPDGPLEGVVRPPHRPTGDPGRSAVPASLRSLSALSGDDLAALAG